MRRHAVAAAITAVVLLHDPVASRAATRARHSTRSTTSTPATQPGATQSGDVDAGASAAPLTLTADGEASGAPASTTLRPGASATLHVTITNTTASQRLSVTMSAVDADVKAGGAITPEPAGSVGDDGASSWLALSDTGLVLAPHASVDEPIAVTVPDEATGGSVAALVRATVTQADTVAGTTPGADTARRGTAASIGVRIDVNAPKRAELSVASVRVVRQDGARRVRITITNEGSTSAPVTGTFTLGTPSVSTPVDLTVGPRSQASVTIPWPASVATTSLTSASLSLHHGNDNAEWSGRIDPADGARLTSASVAPAPTAAAPASGGRPDVSWWLILAIALAIVWLGYEVVAASRSRTTNAANVYVTGAANFGDYAPNGVLQDELVPLVAAINALAQTMQGRGPVAPPPTETPGVEYVEDVHGPAPDAHGDVAGAAVELYDQGDDAPTAVAPEPTPEPAPQPPMPWEPHDVVTQIRAALALIDSRPRHASVWYDDDVIDVLAPDELVDAVATALTVAPTTVRHWLSDETLDAATKPTTSGEHDPADLVRECQVLAAEVEVLKRALSDLA